MTKHATVIASVGLCSPLGRTFDETAAAYARGGRSLKRYPEITGPDGFPQTLSCVLSPAEERNYVRRLQFLFNHALEDCLARRKDLSRLWTRKFHVLLSVPAWMKGTPYFDGFIDLITSAPKIEMTEVRVRHAAHADGLAAIIDAVSAVGDEGYEAVFAVGLDSFIAPKVLDYALAKEDMLVRGNPYGFVPGEACAAFMIAREERFPDGVNILTTGLHVEKVDPAKGLPAMLGLGLGALLQDLADTRFSAKPPGRVLADLNGERWRAEQYGLALANGGQKLGEAARDPECPALAMGELGAATAAVMTALSLAPGPDRETAGIANNPASGHTLVITSDKTGASAAIVVGR